MAHGTNNTFAEAGHVVKKGGWTLDVHLISFLLAGRFEYRTGSKTARLPPPNAGRVL